MYSDMVSSNRKKSNLFEKLDSLEKKLMGKGIKIVMIEDDENEFMLLTKSLKKLGLFVMHQTRVDFKKIDNINPDIIILDIGGIDSWKDVVMKYPDKTIIFSGYASNGRISQDIKDTVSAVIEKKHMEELISIIESRRSKF